jgi:cell division septal protein FtsQ
MYGGVRGALRQFLAEPSTRLGVCASLSVTLGRVRVVVSRALAWWYFWIFFGWLFVVVKNKYPIKYLRNLSYIQFAVEISQ